MRSLRVDARNNLVVLENLEVVDGNDSILQDARNILSMWAGEYPYNTDKGIPYYDALQDGDFNSLKGDMKRALEQDARISLAVVELKKDGEQVKIEAKLTTSDGEVIDV